VRRDIEYLLSIPEDKRKAFDKRINEIKKRMDHIYESAPLAMADPRGSFLAERQGTDSAAFA
jgi:hypothetical protein